MQNGKPWKSKQLIANHELNPTLSQHLYLLQRTALILESDNIIVLNRTQKQTLGQKPK